MQTHVEDIKRRLGTVELLYSENTEDIDLFGWTTQVVQTRDDISAKLRDREATLDQAEKQIDSFKNHLDELIAAKEEHETQLLSKFALLLNEKKLRIRTQQRQLAEAGRPSRAGTSTKSLKVSRKRKQDAKPQDSDTGEESEGFEAMDVDSIHDAAADLDSDQAQMTSSDTDTDIDEDPSLAQRTAAVPAQQPQSARSPTPPPRSLPFGKGSKGTASKTGKSTDTGISKAAEDDGETASEDDEL